MEIIYQDKQIIVCIKPAGIVSTDEPGGMPSLIREALQDTSADIKTVHRLDQVVGGLMVFARSQETASELSRQITEKTFDKDYLAIVHGVPNPEKGRYDDLLFRDTSENKTYVVKRMRRGVREASLEYSVISRKNNLSLVRIHLLTGRTHQIRAQFSSRGLPLTGDRKYGAIGDGCGIALWSYHLKFKHPKTGKGMEFTKEPPGLYPWTEFSPSEQQKENILPPGKENEPVIHVPSNTAEKCPYAKKCGGCQMQNLPYQQQLAVKQKRLGELLGKYGKIQPIIGMDNPYHYRNKCHAALGLDSKGKIISGIYQSSEHRIVAVESCMIEDEKADEIIRSIRGMMKDFKITAYDEKKDTGFLRHILVKRSYKTGETMAVLVTTSPIFKLQKPFLKALLEKHPEITTIIMNINTAYTPVVLGQQEKILYGPGYITDELCGLKFRISAKSFYQVNSRLTETLYNTAIGFAGLTGKETVLDAYCGTGTIGLTAAGKCKSVSGVEINKDAVKDAIKNAKINGIENAWFTCADAGEFMLQMAADRQRCDVVFMDPPRAGSDERFLSSLIKMKPERVVYISCNPETLARDLQALTAGGYRVKRIQPVDMFPHTEHVETVVLMSRVKE